MADEPKPHVGQRFNWYAGPLVALIAASAAVVGVLINLKIISPPSPTPTPTPIPTATPDPPVSTPVPSPTPGTNPVRTSRRIGQSPPPPFPTPAPPPLSDESYFARLLKLDKQAKDAHSADIAGYEQKIADYTSDASSWTSARPEVQDKINSEANAMIDPLNAGYPAMAAVARDIDPINPPYYMVALDRAWRKYGFVPQPQHIYPLPSPAPNPNPKLDAGYFARLLKLDKQAKDAHSADIAGYEQKIADYTSDASSWTSARPEVQDKINSEANAMMDPSNADYPAMAAVARNIDSDNPPYYMVALDRAWRKYGFVPQPQHIYKLP